MPNALAARAGDKVRVKPGTKHAGVRGIVQSLAPEHLAIQLDNGELTALKPTEVLNYSLAARRAWVKMPARRVGRPKGSRHCDRLSVTLRFDKALWHRFLMLEREGKTGDRVALFNRLLSQIVSGSGKADAIAGMHRKKGLL